MALITIDGVKLEVPEHKCVLECALRAGIYIPHLCHHPDLPENGSCRLCVVEVDGMKGGAVLYAESEGRHGGAYQKRTVIEAALHGAGASAGRASGGLLHLPEIRKL